MKATLSPPTNNQNEMYTYIAIPIEALQQSSDQGGQALTVAQNVILKTLSDGQQIQSITVPENIIFRTISRVNKKINQTSKDVHSSTAKSENENRTIQNTTRPTVIEHNSNTHSNNGFVRNSVILKSLANKSDNTNCDKAEVRYLKCRSTQMIDVNRPSPKDSRVGSFKCTICGEILNKMILYRKHMEMHRNTKKYKCEQCSASYNVEDNLKLHMAMHSKGEPTCPICHRKFQRLASLKAHIIIHEVEEIFTCIECLAEYEKEDDLTKHMESHKKGKKENNSDQSPLVCSFCSHTFQDSVEYKQHISYHIKIKRLIINGKKHKRRINTNKDHAYKCDVCKKSFSKLCLLERHSRIHSGEKPFACHLCDRAFNQKGTLQIHLALHTGIKPFECTLCPARFCQKGNLRVHVQKTHVAPGPGEKFYKCTICTCIFKKVSSLNAHITRAHAGEKETDDISDIVEQLRQLEKQMEPKSSEHENQSNDQAAAIKNPSELEVGTIKFVKLVDSSIEDSIRRYWVKQRKMDDNTWYICVYCTKEFKKPSDLIRHIRVHTREKPFKCKQCDQAFSLKSTLITHISTHIGKREYQCLICTKAFASVKTLNSHLRRHEKSNSQQYMCDTCNAVFSTMTKAKLHMELHKADPLNKGLNKLGQMQVVMQQPMVETPSGLLPLKAPKSQTQSSQANSEIRPHKCHFCSATFTKGVHLKRHMLLHSGEKKFKCDICGKAFYLMYALKEHLKFHIGERNFNCKICGKGFVTNAILKRHLTIHSSARPYVCPYCTKRFKTVILCRKHIKIHRRHLNLQIHALNETGELANIEDSNTSPTAGLNESLSDNPFSNALAEDPCNLDLSLDNLTNNTEITEEIDVDRNSFSSNTGSKNGNLQVQEKNSLISKILYSDENGIIISTETENNTQAKDNLQDSLNQQLYQTSTISQDFVDKNINLALMSDPTSINDLGNVEDVLNFSQENLSDENGCPTLFINFDDLQAFTSANLYNACFAQLKQNNDPLLMSELTELQNPNILLSTDPSLNSITDFQDSQAFEMLMPFTFSTNLTLNNLALSTNSLSGLSTSFPNIIVSNVEDNTDLNQTSVLPSISEITKKPGVNFNSFNNIVTSSGKICEGNDIQSLDIIQNNAAGLSDDSITGIVQEGTILSNLLYNTNQLDIILNGSSETVSKVGFDNNIDNCVESVETAVNGTNVFQKIDFACSTCKQVCKSLKDLKDHNCHGESNSETSKEQNQNCKQNLSKQIIPPGNNEANIVPLLKSKQNEENNTNNKPEEEQHKCNHCDKVLATKNALSRHVLIHKEKKTAVNNSCSYCGKLFKKRSDLERHIRTHTGEKPFGCDKCGKCFSLKSTLESHYRTHNPGGNKEFSCAVCSSYFSSKSSLKVHVLMHTGIKPYQCTMCPEQFRTSGHRKSHMSNHLNQTETKKNPQTKNAKVNNLLASVIMESHGEQNTLKNQQLVNVENVVATGRKENFPTIVQEPDHDSLSLNQAIQVDPLFLQQLQLNNVLLQDNTEDLSFIQVDTNNDIQIANMKSLLNNGNDINNFEDSLYEGMTLEKDKPQSSLHISKKPILITKDFECYTCHKKYSSKSVLTKHKKIHIANGIYKCTKCNNAFNSDDELSNHLKLHAGYRPYCCQLCTNTFSLEKNLKTHMKRIHGIVLQN